MGRENSRSFEDEFCLVVAAFSFDSTTDKRFKNSSGEVLNYLKIKQIYSSGRVLVGSSKVLTDKWFQGISWIFGNNE